MSDKAKIWPEKVRLDTDRAGMNERVSDYLDRTADPYFASVRDLLEAWLSRVPAAEHPRLIAELRADDVQFEGAFWELYLHEAYRRWGYEITFHPIAPGSAKRPDFLLRGKDQFYVEARAVQRASARAAADRRLAEIYEALRSYEDDVAFHVVASHVSIGSGSPSIRDLIRFVVTWLRSLDEEEALGRYAHSGIVALPTTIWRSDGWAIEFIAVPKRAWSNRDSTLMRMWGAAEPTKIENHLAIGRALERKGSRYGLLDHPLVIAILANTEYPTDLHHIERALYGLHLPHPPDGVPDAATLQPAGDGFWITKAGLRRAQVPQVVTASNLHIGSLTAAPVAWPHPGTSGKLPQQPPLFASAQLGPLRIAPGMDPARYLELPPAITGVAY